MTAYNDIPLKRGIGIPDAFWYNNAVKYLFLFYTFFCASSLTELFAQSTARSAAELFRLVYQERKADVPFDFECTAFTSYSTQGKPTNFSAFDGTGAIIFITHKSISNLFMRAGDRIRAKGKTRLYDFNQIVALCNSIEHIGQGAAPSPEHVSASDLDSGRFDCRLVKVKGTLRDAFQDEIDTNFRYFVLNCDGKLIYASSSQIAVNDAAIGSEIEITGICDPFPIGGRRHIGRLLRVSGRDAVKVQKSPGDDAFSAPMLDDSPAMGPMEIQSLGLRRAKGTVIAAWHPRNILIETEQKNLIYATAASRELPASGSGVEVEGVPETDLFNITLSRAVWRACDLEPALPQKPLDIDFDKLLGSNGNRTLNPYFNGRTIRIKGRVIGTESPAKHTETILISGNGRILAIDTSTVPGAANGISAGCRIEVTGVCILETENWRPNALFPPASGYRVVVRSPQDLKILSHPPWWTPGRLLVVIAVLAAVLAGLLIRLAVRKRFTAIIAKAKIAAKVGERTRLAVELHDSIAQDLTGVAMELRSAMRAQNAAPEMTGRHLNRAAATLDSCRDELRNCIWDLRSLTLDDASVDMAIRRTLQQHLSGAHLEVRFGVGRRFFTDNTLHTVLRVVRELTINAVRHGAAKNIKIAGCLDGGWLLFSVKDDGCGFDPGRVPSVESGHFGLQGIRERIESLEGSVEIDSAPGSGTKVTVSIPLEKRDKEIAR